MTRITNKGKVKHGAAAPMFISTWDTTQAGSANDTIVLPLVSNGDYDFYVKWGDGSIDNITGYNQSEVTHQYENTGIYTIKIFGDISGWRFAAVGDDDKILNISQWGPLTINSDRAFGGCSLLDLSATDSPTITSTNGCQYLFDGCSSLTSGGLDNFDVGLATSLQGMFVNCTGFNDAAVRSFDLTNITSMNSMFYNCDAFDVSLSGMDFTNVGDFRNMFNLTDYFSRHTIEGWTFGTNVQGLFSSYNSGYFDQSNIWNNIPNLSSITGARFLFQNSDFDGMNWVTGMNFGYIEDAIGIFYSSDFPAGFTLSGIDFSSVKNFDYAFQYVNQFGPFVSTPSLPDLRGVTTGLESTVAMFERAYYFNEELLLDTRNVTNMAYMFDNADDFNNGGSPSISGWDTSKVTTMQGMFEDASAFNQPIGSWDVGNVTDMYRMFRDAIVFNQPLSGWNTSNVTDMSLMFYGARDFNQDIGSWDVGKVTTMQNMFYALSFIGPSSFNNGGSDSIKDWNTSSLTNIQSMFYNADYFDQPLTNWIVTGITSAANFMAAANGLSTTNYDRTLSGWSSQAVQNGVNIHFGGSQYSTATGLAYRNALVASGWTITDGGAV